MSQKKSIQFEGTVLYLILAAICLLFYDCGTAAADYSFYLDRFDVSGQVDESDEFDDDDIKPWEIYDPTVVENGDFVSFSSPGTVINGVVNDVPYLNEMSFIGSGTSSEFAVSNDAGDFTGISKWEPIIPGVNQWYEMQVGYELSGDPYKSIDISVGVANWGSDFASIMEIAPGLGITFYFSGDTLGWKHILVDEDDFSSAGAILLSLDFYDDSDDFRAGFSLDGGANYTYFSERIGWDQETPGNYEWYFSGQTIELVPVPGAVLLGMLGLSVAGVKLRKHS